MSDNPESIRLDKWLWAARFFKTRKLAAEAISGGKVHVNGQHCKPGKDVKAGSHVSISKNGFKWELVVKQVSKQRRPAEEAALLYEESESSRQKRQQETALRREQRALLPHAERAGRPNKKQRRLIHRFKQDY